MDDGSTDEADAGNVTRWAEGCRRHKAIRQLWDAYRPTWLLNVLVPGFGEMVHRLGAMTAMSRKPFLPIVLRVPLLAGLVIAMSDPVRTISRLRAHTRPHSNHCLGQIEADLRMASANPVSH
jgi:hypothetical protein